MSAVPSSTNSQYGVCGITTEEIEIPAWVLPCKHVFERSAIYEWQAYCQSLGRKVTCPLDQGEISISDTNPSLVADAPIAVMEPSIEDPAAHVSPVQAPVENPVQILRKHFIGIGTNDAILPIEAHGIYMLTDTTETEIRYRFSGDAINRFALAYFSLHGSNSRWQVEIRQFLNGRGGGHSITQTNYQCNPIR